MTKYVIAAGLVAACIVVSIVRSCVDGWDDIDWNWDWQADLEDDDTP